MTTTLNLEGVKSTDGPMLITNEHGTVAEYNKVAGVEEYTLLENGKLWKYSWHEGAPVGKMYRNGDYVGVCDKRAFQFAAKAFWTIAALF